MIDTASAILKPSKVLPSSLIVTEPSLLLSILLKIVRRQVPDDFICSMIIERASHLPPALRTYSTSIMKADGASSSFTSSAFSRFEVKAAEVTEGFCWPKVVCLITGMTGTTGASTFSATTS